MLSALGCFLEATRRRIRVQTILVSSHRIVDRLHYKADLLTALAERGEVDAALRRRWCPGRLARSAATVTG